MAYRKIGNGEHTLIAFHGYDQEGSVFEVFRPSLGTFYTIISIDLPHQGQTEWREDTLSKDMLRQLVADFLIHINHTGKVSILGYSLGGNYALGFYVAAPEIVEGIWLMAADGIKYKPAFAFLTKTGIGRFFFLRFVHRADSILMVLRLAHKVRILPERVATFYQNSIDSREKRTALYDRWMSASRIAPAISQVVKAIGRYQPYVFLVFGKNDPVIPVSNALNFKRKIPTAHLEVLDQGHNILKAKNNEVISKLLATLKHA